MTASPCCPPTFGRSFEAGKGPHGRRTENRRRLFPGAAHRCRQAPGGYARRRPEEIRGTEEAVNAAGGGGGRRGGWTARLLDRRGGPSRRSWSPATSSPAATPSGRRRTSPCNPVGPSRRRRSISARTNRGLLRLAHGPRKSDLRARGRQSPLAMAFRRGLGKDPQRFRQAGRDAHQPAAAGLARRRIRGAQLQHEGDAPPHRHLRDLQARLGGRPPSATAK